MNNLPTPLIAAAVFALLFVLERLFPLSNTTPLLVARLPMRTGRLMSFDNRTGRSREQFH
jgi:hypothetical protein